MHYIQQIQEYSNENRDKNLAYMYTLLWGIPRCLEGIVASRYLIVFDMQEEGAY